jgi:hypothetical protein
VGVVTKQQRKTLKRIGNLHRMMAGGGSPNEREQARARLEAELKKLGKTWNDLADLLIQEKQAELEEKQEQAAAQGATYDPQTEAAIKPKGIPCIDLVYDQLTRYLDLKDHEFTAVTLWILHTHVFERFMCTPRLTLMSPAPDCGKTTALSILEKLVARPEKSDNTTAAAIYWLLDQGSRTFLLDEMDNAELLRNGTLRSVLNSGHRRGGTIRRFISGRPKRFSTFAPMALAAINTHQPLPWPILSRSIRIDMQRSRKPLQRFDSRDTEDLDIVRGQVWLWAHPDLKLSPNPRIPSGLRTRPRDNWLPLVSIADSFGPAWGQLARDAAVAFAATRREEDVGVLLLEDIYEIFTALDVDRLWSKTLVEHLHALTDAGWDELPLTPSRLAKILAPFGIKPKAVWPKGLDRSRSRSSKGYHRDQFETAWANYCQDDVPPAQKGGKIRYLRSV